jgi:3-oxoacyl-[acyl-carrier protein] reductase
VALVTGAARGIGAATARAFVRAGASVGALDLEPGPLAALAGELGPACGAFPADVRDAEAVGRAVAALVAAHGRIDVLVNNAGTVRDATLARVADADWADTIAVNLTGAMVCARAVVPAMLAARSGRILSATSIVARQGNYGQTAYAASKAGIIGLTRAWARELGPQGVTANAVAPGFIETEMLKSVPDKVKERVRARVPAGRLGTPEDVAAVYLFLASEWGSFLNGAVVAVDGGLMI